MRVLLLLLAILFFSAAAQGRAYCPRVTSEHNADTTDLKRFRNFHLWKDKTGNELAYAIWQYLCGYETGLYHFYEVHDGPDPYGEYSTMREPLKMLNVYNMGYCGIFGPTVEGIYHGVGFETGRSFFLAKWSHCATEISYDNDWHYIDVDVRGVLLRPDGTVASLEEARTKRELWVNPKRTAEPFFPHHDTPARAARVFDIYSTSEYGYQYRWFQGSHTADYSLRPGESLTRFWQPQGGRWNHRASYNQAQWVRKLIETPPRGMKPNHRNFTKWNHGNGLFHYAPKLTAGSKDLAEGACVARGLVPGAEGLHLTAGERGHGAVIFEVFTPFVIVPKVNDLDDFDDDAEASVISLDAAVAVKVSLSLDNGLSWQEAGVLEPGKRTLDLTRWVKGGYGYLVQLKMAGEAGDVAIRSMAIDTWVQVAPISLPRLKKGANRLRYDAGDRYDGITAPMLVLPNVADPDDLKKHVLELPKRYNPKRNTGRIQGDVVLKLIPLGGTKISWFSVGATFSTIQGKGATQTANAIAYAVGEPVAANFKEAYKAKVPTWAGHWRYNHDTDVKLDEPAEAVYVKFTGKPAVNVIRACLHLTPPTKHDPAVKITHGYKLDGKMTEKAVEMKKPGDYRVDCPGEVENVFIRIEKPSR
jgi:hypothetical protein